MKNDVALDLLRPLKLEGNFIHEHSKVTESYIRVPYILSKHLTYYGYLILIILINFGNVAPYLLTIMLVLTEKLHR